MELSKYSVVSPDGWHYVPLECSACEISIASGEFNILELIALAEAHESVCEPKIWTREQLLYEGTEEYPDVWGHPTSVTDAYRREFEETSSKLLAFYRFTKREI